LEQQIAGSSQLANQTVYAQVPSLIPQNISGINSGSICLYNIQRHCKKSYFQKMDQLKDEKKKKRIHFTERHLL
jgi:hypothetical protein